MEYIFNVKTNTKLFMELIKSLPNDIEFNFNEYGNDCIGYNDISGCVWIALENDIVASNDGRNISFIKRNFETDEEINFDSYEEAIYKKGEEEEDQHTCGDTGGKNFVKGCGDKVPASDTFMIDNTSFCIQCYEKYDEEYENEEDEKDEDDKYICNT